jgi:catechol 2,3-dioxygenase-like lactoylglutathione lyase family enzyme
VILPTVANVPARCKELLQKADHVQRDLLKVVSLFYGKGQRGWEGFFRDKLGFKVDFLHGHPAFYGGVSRDGATLHLRFVHEPVITQELRQKEELLAAFVRVENIKALFEEYKLKGAPLVGTLHKEAWGGPTFKVQDPDGNWICFSAT